MSNKVQNNRRELSAVKYVRKTRRINAPRSLNGGPGAHCVGDDNGRKVVGVLHNGMISSGEVQLSILELFENIVG